MINEPLGVDDFGRLRDLVASFAPAGRINVDQVHVGCGFRRGCVWWWGKEWKREREGRRKRERKRERTH